MRMLLILCHLFGFGLSKNLQRECKVSNYGSEYTGAVNQTKSGLECQRWDSQYPHTHSFDQGLYFPDGTMEYASNNCRNPDFYHHGPWCYTTDPEVRWEMCDVPSCHDKPECKFTESGTEYRGSKNVTASGTACQPWTNEYSERESNFCRNPDGKPLNPWCFVNNDEWEYCEIPICKPSASCFIGSGWDYMGTKALTRTNRVCQRWDTQHPHTHSYHSEHFLEDFIEDVENYCRNPRNERERPWCFTTDPDLIWEFCDIPECSECKSDTLGRGYAGQKNVTGSGIHCQRWDSNYPHNHNYTDSNRFPDINVTFTANFCRNPNGRENGPWCYTMDPNIEWQYCEIPLCQEKSYVTKHILHIGVDGLDPCFVNASSGVPNILNRLGQQGSYTIDAGRAVIPAYSGPNWTAHLAGLNVPDSGVTSNGWGPSWRGYSTNITPVTGKHVAFQTIASYLRASNENIRTAYFQDWDWLVHVGNYGHPGSLHKELYCSVDEEEQNYKLCDEYLVGNATEYLHDILHASESSYTFIYLANLDVVGHTLTWCNDQYLNYVNVVDDQVGQLLDVIDTEETWDNTVVVLSTDHGGFAFSHGWDDDRDLPIPLFIRGSGIKENYELKYSVKNYDIAPTIAHALGIKANSRWSGQVIDEAFK